MQFFNLFFSVYPSAYWAMRWDALLETPAKIGGVQLRATVTGAIAGDSLAAENMSTGDGVGGPFTVV